MGQIWTKDKDAKENEAIRKLVSDMLKDKEINNKFIPDMLEEKIYENVLEVVMSQIKLTLESTKIEFMNHEINFVVKPIVIEEKEEE